MVPAEGRLQRLDAGRIEDLRGIMEAIDSFWIRNERLPASLEVLGADPRVQVNTVDPGSAEPYEYYPLDEDTYEPCASFDGESPRPSRRGRGAAHQLTSGATGWAGSASS